MHRKFNVNDYVIQAEWYSILNSQLSGRPKCIQLNEQQQDNKQKTRNK